jgi:predicted transglutaminase-like cysteine proteinase
MIPFNLSIGRRLAALVMVFGSVVATANTGLANSLTLVSTQNLTPQQALKSQLLERRFELVLARHDKNLREAEVRCEAGERSACRLAKWQTFLQEISSAPLPDQLYRVNRYINHVRQRTDERNWDRSDFWAVPEEFFARGGDCEDYAIAKYVSLRSLGVPAERLRVVVVYDSKRREDHAVLVIMAPEGMKVLDNKRKRVVDWDETSKRYRPYYSLNEQAVWIHNSKT